MKMPVVQTMKDHMPAIAMLVILEMDGIALVSTMILIDIFSVLISPDSMICENLLQILMNV